MSKLVEGIKWEMVVANSLNNILVETDLQSIIRSISSGTNTLFPADIVETNFQALIATNDKAKWNSYLAKISSSHCPLNQEINLIINGRFYSFLVNSRRDNSGFKHNLIDITKLKDSYFEDRSINFPEIESLSIESLLTLIHEIKQPIAAISYYARGCIWAIRNHQETDEIIASLEEIIGQVDRSINIFQSIKPSLSIDNNQLEQINLNAFVAETLTTLRRYTNQKVNFVSDFAVNLPEIAADKVQLEIAIVNLLTNAMEAAYVIDPNTSIFIKTGVEDKYVTLVISNKAYKELVNVAKMFEPFYTSKSSHTGLGLCITTHIIKSHNGIIEAKNEQGLISFNIKLPYS